MHRTFSALIILNSSYWLENTLEMVPQGSRLPEDFHLELFASFFMHVNSLLRTGKNDFLHHRHEVKEELLCNIVADVEGGFLLPNGSRVPGELEPDELEIITRLVCYLYDEFMTCVDHRCLDCTATIEFKRLVGYDIVIQYHSERHPFACPGSRQLSLIHRAQEMNDGIAPPRHWA